MKRFGLFLLAAVMVAGLAGCASTGVTQIKAAPPRDKNCNLEIFTNVSEIKRPYEVVCIIDARTGNTSDDKTTAGAIKLTKPDACKCGADAILIENLSTQGVTAFSWGEGRAIVKAIKFTDK
jgi:hypothetical protein